MKSEQFQKMEERYRRATGLVLEGRKVFRGIKHKPCYGKCQQCAWFFNKGCSEWNGVDNFYGTE